ncbi:hypothetical protein [Evansella clarkii]|uniref:hypothetical protein n=1 Tax=Evansella clarkii TaxID=79879 RepID=UPI000996DF75|nr:hypothetical protein [Evansella clarkii]
MVTEFNLIDIIYQVFALIIPVSIIILIIYFVRSTRKKSEQLKKIEQKINDLDKKVNSLSANDER